MPIGSQDISFLGKGQTMATTRWFCGIALAAALICGTAAGKEIFVKSGEDGDGSMVKPYGTLWKALDKASRGDTIRVAGGVYEGKGGCGGWLIKVPNLTVVGGYAADFSSRDPFKNPTILQRAKDYKGDWTGLKDAIVAGDQDHSGLVFDGFVLDAQSRNAYNAEGNVLPQKSFQGMIFKTSSKDIKIRNCIMLNPYGDGIECTWSGTGNEVSNCFVLNTFYEGISTRMAQDGAKVLIKNNTIAFGWFQPGKGGAIGVFVGRQGKTVIEDNVIGFLVTEGDEAGFAVTNTFGNDRTELKGNVFAQCQGGYYKYMDSDKKNLVVWKPADLEALNKDAESCMLAKAGENVEADPGLRPDKTHFGRFSDYCASEPGKLNMDLMNQWRSAVGLNLQAEKGTSRKNFGLAYPREAVVPGLVSSIKGKGVQVAGPFEAYAAASGAGEAAPEAAAATKKDYTTVEFDTFKKGAAGVKELAGKAVSFKAGIGSSSTEYLLKYAPRDQHACYKLIAPGESTMTTKAVFGYFLKGSDAHKAFEKHLKKQADVNKEGGLTIKGTAWYVGKDTYAYPVGVIVDEVVKE
jgi:hypothetical protein